MQEIIDRCEQKYFLSNEQYNNFLDKVEKYLKKDKYFSEKIYNIYFDNDNYELINISLDKPVYKEKIRLRSYEEESNDTMVFLEIKKKYQDHTNKRRIIIKYQDYLKYIEKGILPECDRQILNEINYCFERYFLKPKIKVCYDRLSYYLKNDSSFRITFDNNIQYNFSDIALIAKNDDKLLFKDGYIMEFKTFKGIPLWLNEILNELKIYPTSYSKVGKIVEKEGKIYV